MRVLRKAETTKRGCSYCTDIIRERIEKTGGGRSRCPHEECPYKVLDKYDTYEDYMQGDECKEILKAMLDIAEEQARGIPGELVYSFEEIISSVFS